MLLWDKMGHAVQLPTVWAFNWYKGNPLAATTGCTSFLRLLLGDNSHLVVGPLATVVALVGVVVEAEHLPTSFTVEGKEIKLVTTFL